MPNELRTYIQFRELCCIVMGGIVGLLIVLPFVLSKAQNPGSFLNTVLLIAAVFFGILAGYRHRRNHVFFYFLMVAVLVLAGLLASSGNQS